MQNDAGSSLIPHELQEAVLISAFRYALGRQTYVVSEITQSIRYAWERLDKNCRTLIKREIRQAQARDGLGNPSIDAPDWLAILELPDE
jgi:hypothetical protein